METERTFKLGLKEETTFRIPVKFTDSVATGRSVVPYSIHTRAKDGRTGERHGFFAVHMLRPNNEKTPKLLFHATLDDTGPATSAHGPVTSTVECPFFVPGKIGKAMGPGTRAIAFPAEGNVRGESGTVSIWVRPPDKEFSNSVLLRIWGHGYFLAAVAAHSMEFEGQRVDIKYPQNVVDRWHHMAITWDTETAAFYVDGKQIRTIKRPILEPPCRNIQLTALSGFYLDDLRIYSAPLNPSQIQDLCKDLRFGGTKK